MRLTLLSLEHTVTCNSTLSLPLHQELLKGQGYLFLLTLMFPRPRPVVGVQESGLNLLLTTLYALGTHTHTHTHAKLINRHTEWNNQRALEQTPCVSHHNRTQTDGVLCEALSTITSTCAPATSASSSHSSHVRWFERGLSFPVYA